jgi:hypothetical protein
VHLYLLTWIQFQTADIHPPQSPTNRSTVSISSEYSSEAPLALQATKKFKMASASASSQHVKTHDKLPKVKRIDLPSTSGSSGLATKNRLGSASSTPTIPSTSSTNQTSLPKLSFKKKKQVEPSTERRKSPGLPSQATDQPSTSNSIRTRPSVRVPSPSRQAFLDGVHQTDSSHAVEDLFSAEWQHNPMTEVDQFLADIMPIEYVKKFFPACTHLIRTCYIQISCTTRVSPYIFLTSLCNCLILYRESTGQDSEPIAPSRKPVAVSSSTYK